MKNLEKTKFVVLDFDGVLTSIDDGTSFKVATTESYGPSVNLVNRFKKFLDDNDSKVVIASNWRKFEKDDKLSFNGVQFQNPLPNLLKHIKKYVIGTLEPSHGISKCEALDLFFEDNDVNPYDCRYVIFDDRLEEGYAAHPIFYQHFVHTDAKTGLTEDDISKATEIINKY